MNESTKGIETGRYKALIQNLLKFLTVNTFLNF